MPSKELQQQRAIAARLTCGNVKASQKSIHKAISNYEWDNEKAFSDKDLDRYPILLEGDEYESNDQVLVRWKVFKISHNSVMVVRTYMAWALDKYSSYSCGDGVLYTMNPNYHSNLCDLLQDLIDLNWYHKLHFPVKESRTMATSKILGTFYNPKNLVLYAIVSIDNNFIIHCRLKNDRVIRYRTTYVAQQCLEDLAQSTLRFATL